MIDITHLDKAAVLAALYNAAHPRRDCETYIPFTTEHAAEHLATDNYFYVLHGVKLNVVLVGDSFDPKNYDRMYGEGAAAEAIGGIRVGAAWIFEGLLSPDVLEAAVNYERTHPEPAVDTVDDPVSDESPPASVRLDEAENENTRHEDSLKSSDLCVVCAGVGPLDNYIRCWQCEYICPDCNFCLIDGHFCENCDDFYTPE